MSGRYSDALRVLRLLDAIRGSGRTLSELRASFQISAATLRRDLTALRQAGFEITESFEGRRKRVQCNSTTLRMSPETAAWLVLTTLFDEIHGGLAESHLAELRSLALRRLGLDEEAVSTRLLRLPAPREASTISIPLREVLEATLMDRVLRVKYRSYAATTAVEYRLAPWSIVRQGDRVYVVGPSLDDNPEQPIRLRLDRMFEAEAMRAQFRRPESWDPHQSFEGRFGAWHDDKDPEWVVLSFDPRAGREMLHVELPCFDRRQRTASDGRLILELLVHPDKSFIRWLRRKNDEVVVLEPGWLRSQLVGQFQRMLSLYAEIEQARPHSA